VSVVLVTGPPRAGVTSIVAELRRRLPSYRFVESAAPGRPDAVVFVVSAVAPMTESDCLLADSATADTAAVIAVVSKIDDHLRWRDVLAEDRERLAGAAARLATTPWVGAAAAPRLGGPLLDELVHLLDAQLRDPALTERNSLHIKQTRICQLRDRREQLVRRRRLAAPERMSALRGTVQQARLTMAHTARRRCSALRTELVAAAAGLRRADVADFPDRVRRRCAEVLDGVEADVVACAGELVGELVGEVGAASPSVGVAGPPLASRRLETQLMTVLGVGFGIGVALVVTRFLAGLAPDLAAAGVIAGGVAGLTTTAWVVRARALLHDRAVLERWVGEVAATVRAAAEQRVATGMLAAEVAMAAAGMAAAAEEDAEIGRRIAALDSEIRELVGRP
jgi:hypothetical protein